MNGAIHHLDDKTVKQINKFILGNFSEAIFLSIDPVKHYNNIINKLMIRFDRGNFIRNKKDFNELMINYESLIIDDFYKMKDLEEFGLGFNQIDAMLLYCILSHYKPSKYRGFKEV